MIWVTPYEDGRNGWRLQSLLGRYQSQRLLWNLNLVDQIRGFYHCCHCPDILGILGYLWSIHDGRLLAKDPSLSTASGMRKCIKQLCGSNPNIDNVYTKTGTGIRSTLADWYFKKKKRHPCKHCSFHILLLLPPSLPPTPALVHSATVPSCDSAAPRAAVMETQVPLMTDAMADHGRVNAELFHSSKQKKLLFSSVKKSCF